MQTTKIKYFFKNRVLKGILNEEEIDTSIFQEKKKVEEVIPGITPVVVETEDQKKNAKKK